MFEEDLDFQMDLGHVPDQSEINWETQYYSRHEVMLIQIKLIIESVGFCTKIYELIYSCLLLDLIWLSPHTFLTC